MGLTGRIEKDKPVVFFNGNCQAQYLAAVFAHSGLVESYAIGNDRGFLPSFGGKVARYLSEGEALAIAADARSEGRQVIAATQVVEKGPVDGRFEGADREIKFPHLQLNSINPTEHGARGKDDIHRLFRSDVITMQRSQDAAGATRFAYATLIHEQFRREPLFHTVLHPGALLSALLAEDVAIKVGLSFYEKLRPIIADIKATEGMNFVSDHPLSRESIQVLGCEWRWYEVYRHTVAASRSDDPEFVLGNKKALNEFFGHETVYWQALMRSHLAVGQFDEARHASRELEYRAPGYVRTWFNRIDLERKASANDDVIEVILNDAASALRHSRQSLHLRAIVAMRVMKPEAGLEAARRYHEASPDIPFSVRPLVRILARLERRKEAVDVLRSHCATLGAQDRSRLLNALQDVPQVTELAAA